MVKIWHVLPLTYKSAPLENIGPTMRTVKACRVGPHLPPGLQPYRRLLVTSPSIDHGLTQHGCQQCHRPVGFSWHRWARRPARRAAGGAFLIPFYHRPRWPHAHGLCHLASCHNTRSLCVDSFTSQKKAGQFRDGARKTSNGRSLREVLTIFDPPTPPNPHACDANVARSHPIVPNLSCVARPGQYVEYIRQHQRP